MFSVDSSSSQNSFATFAGGCFWCIEAAFTDLKGVISTTSGLTGGDTTNPTYEQVHHDSSGHREAVLVEYNPNLITYQQLLDQFWRQIDPTDAGGQFIDRGPVYTTAIYYHTDEQKNLAQASKKSLQESKKFDKPIVTQILPASKFYQAHQYQQDFAKKHPLRYQLYKKGSGRSDFIHQTWPGEDIK